MLSDQQNGTYRRMQRGGFGNSMLGPMLQQHIMSQGAAPITQRMNTNRGVNAQANPGQGFGVHRGITEHPGVMPPPPLPDPSAGPIHGGPGPAQQGGINPLLAQLGMMLLAAQQGRGGAR